MHTQDLSPWTHSHMFDGGSHAAERGTRMVMWITAAMMVVEILAGWWFNSMALLADGWHMSSHAFAIGLSAFAYVAARRYARDSRFAFGTWKIEILAGYTSALFLLGVASVMVFASVERIIAPQAIHFPEAIVVAVAGLVVNIACALILGRAEEHHDHASDRHGPDHHHHDLNLRSAYPHIIADAATSVLAIVALVGGMLFGWSWLVSLPVVSDHVRCTGAAPVGPSCRCNFALSLVVAPAAADLRRMQAGRSFLELRRSEHCDGERSAMRHAVRHCASDASSPREK